ncbi:WXG100 family type VII secretion target [Streptomyces sp. 6N223]|uniref:WXG100 family type VII secretion target n=1 Tax=Streptomyces sp. 6N223 TaxID=3457412 RepID=UPI003FD1A4C5
MGDGRDGMNLTYDQMHDAGDHLISEHERLRGELDDIKTYVDDLLEDGFTTQQASGAFGDSYTEFTEGVKQMLEGMEGMGNFLHSAADGLEDQDAEYASQVSGS